MKKYTSILMMCARQSIYKILTALATLIVVEGIWYYLEISKGEKGLGQIYQALPLYGAFFLAWWAITIILGIYGCRVKTDTPSLFRRLQVSSGQIFWLQTLYNCVVYVMLLSFQFIILIVMGLIYCNLFPDQSGPQTIFIALVDEPYSYIEPVLIDMVSPFLGSINWVLRIASIGIFATTTAGITTRVLD